MNFKIKQTFSSALFVLATAVASTAADDSKPDGFAWNSPVPEDCPFELSESFQGVYFTGRHGDYQVGDTFYPSWASDGNLYSPWTDGTTDGIYASSGGGLKTG